MKRYFLIFLFFSSSLYAQIRFGEAKGLFMSLGVGPRFPIGDFADNQNIGVGVEATFSYTDNEFLPIFIYATIGYQHYPGKQSFYKRSDYSSFSSNVVIIASGVRYYFKPLFEQVVLLMPIIDAGLEYALFEKLHQFKPGTGKSNFVEEVGKFGFHLGAGFSMFLLDVITYYNYLPNNQYLSFNLKVNIPIFVKI